MDQYEAGLRRTRRHDGEDRQGCTGHDVLQKGGSTPMIDGQWLVSVIVVLVCVAAVIGVVLYLNTYFS